MNNLQDFPSFINYFRQLATEHRLLRGFMHGPATRAMALNRSTLDYPCLWLETPSYTPGDNGAEHTAGTWSSAIIVMKPGSDSYEEEDQAWADTLAIITSVLSRMKKDFPRQFQFTRPVEPINPMFVSRLVGWRYELDILEDLNLCYLPEEWEEAEG